MGRHDGCKLLTLGKNCQYEGRAHVYIPFSYTFQVPQLVQLNSTCRSLSEKACDCLMLLQVATFKVFVIKRRIEVEDHLQVLELCFAQKPQGGWKLFWKTSTHACPGSVQGCSQMDREGLNLMHNSTERFADPPQCLHRRRIPVHSIVGSRPAFLPGR